MADASCPPSQTHEYATRVATLKEPKSRTESNAGGGTAPEFGAVTIDFNPGPDAEDRLRRLFTLLLNHVASSEEADPGEGLQADRPAKDSAALEAAVRDAADAL